MVSELVTTLRAANGPPASLSFSTDVTNKLTSSTELALGSLVIAPIEGSAASGVSFSTSSLPVASRASQLIAAPVAEIGYSAYEVGASQPTLTLGSGDTTTITISGTTVGSGYTQIQVDGNVTLDGTLSVALSGGFTPVVGQTFDIITFGGSLSGTFSNATGLFQNGDVRFEIVHQADKVQLVVQSVAGTTGGLNISALTSAARDALGKVFSSYFPMDPLTVTGVDVAFGGFVTLSGSFGFQRTTTGVKVVGQGISATLAAGSASVGISSADIAVLLNNGGSRLLYATGNFTLNAGSAFGSATGTVMAAHNNTGAATASETITVGGISVAVPALGSGVQTLSGTNLSVIVTDFVTLSGDFGFQKDGSGDVYGVISNGSASLISGSSQVGVTGATLGLILKSAGGIALQSTGGTASVTLPAALTSVTTGAVTVSYNTTGAAVNTTLTIGAVSATVNVASGSMATPFAQVSVVNLQATLGGFASITGHFGFTKAASGDLSATVSAGSASVSTTGGSYGVSLTNASLALRVKTDGTLAFSASAGTTLLTLPTQIGSATASGLTIDYNTTGAAVNETLNIGGVSAVLNVASGTTVAPHAVATVTGFSASVANFTSLAGNFAVQKAASGDLTLLSSNASASLVAGSASVGVTSATFGLVVKNGGGVVFDGSGAASLTLPGLATATATSVRVSYNTTGAAVNQTITLGAVSALIDVALGSVGSPFTQVTAAGFSGSFTNFVTISGDFGFKKNSGGDLEVAVSGASALLSTPAATIGVSSASLGLLVKSTGGIALSASGSAVLTLPSSFATVSATSISVDYNTTGAAVSQTLTVGSITKVLNVASGSTGTPYAAVTATGFVATFTDFVTLRGDFGFQKNAGGDLIIAGDNISAQLEVGSAVRVGLTGAKAGIVVLANEKVAFEASGGSALVNLGSGFATATATSVAVAYNNTGAAVNTTASVTVGSTTVSAPVNVANGVTSVTVTGLQAAISEFITISGNFGVEKTGAGDLEVVGTSVTARLEVGSAVKVGVTNATLGLLVKTDQTFALQTTGGSLDVNLGSGFATATATTVNVRYNNTGANVSQTLSVTAGGSTITAQVNVNNGTISVVAGGVNAQVGGFVTLSGDMGFKKNAAGRLIAAGSNVSATLELGSVLKAGVTGATVGLIVTADEKVALQTTGGAALLNLGSGFVTATATSVNVAFNNTGADVNSTITGLGGVISADVNVVSGVTSVTLTGLSATISDFVTISGNFGFRKTASRFEIVSDSASAKLELGAVIKVGVTGAKVAVVLNDDATNTFAFQTSGGSVDLNLGSGFATATATSVLVRYNNTAATVNETITVTVGTSSVSSAINVGAGITSVLVNGLSAQVAGFVTLTGNFGFKHFASGRIQASADAASATLDLGSVLKAGVTNAKLGLIITDTNKVALQSTGGSVSLNLGAGFATATATSVNVAFNNTGANVNVTLTGTDVSTPINVADGVTSVTVFGLNVAISEFVTISGDFGFKKTASRLEVVANSASALLEVGSLVKVGLTGAKIALVVNDDATNTFAVQSTGGSASIDLGSGFATATATTVAVRYNNTAALVNETLTVSVGGTSISAGINVAAGTTSVVVTGLQAQIGGFVTLSGDMGFKKDATGRLIAAGNNVSATLDVGAVVKAGVTGATVGLIVTSDNKVALQATGGTASLVLGGGFASATATSVGVSYNNTGANVNTTITSASAGISAPINVNDGVTSVTVTGLSATVSEFVTISGDFGFKKDASDNLIIVGNAATARLEVGSVIRVGVTGATLGVFIKPDQTFALQTSNGSASLTLGAGFATATATTLAVRYNNTGATVNQTLSVVVGGTTINAPVNVADGTISVVATGLNAQIGGFVTLSGDMGFKKDATGRLIAAGNNVSATLDAGSVVKAGVTGATFGLIVTSNEKVALQATGGSVSVTLGSGFASATATSVGVVYNNTGANVNTTITGTAAGISAPINVNDGVAAVTLTGFNASVSEFVTISGDFGAKLDASGDLIVVGNSATARLEVGSIVKVGVTGATLALLVKADQTLALQTSNGSLALDLGSGFATATATGVLVRLNNTGSNLTNQTLSVTTGSTTLSAPINVATGVTSVVLNGLNAQVAQFVTITGDFGFKKTASGRLQGSADNASATLDAGALIKVGVTNAKVGFIILPDQTVALQATTGTASVVLGGGFASATAANVAVAFNNTGADVNVTLTGTGISTPINVVNGVTAVVVTDLNATVSDFVTITGTFGFRKTAGGDLEAAASGASATLDVGSVVKAGVTGANVGLIVKADGKLALQATGGTASLVLGSGFASATATSVGVSFNNTGAAVASTINISVAGSSVSAPVNVADNVTSVTVTGLSATISEFVTISGDYGFKKDASGNLIIVGNNATARLEVGSVVKVGVTGATLGLLIKADQTFAFQTSNGSLEVNLGSGFATATATTVAVRYNNTGALVNQTLSVAVGGTTISAPVNVASGTTSVVVTGLQAQIGGFVTLSGDMGFKKDATGRLIAAGNNVSATLDVGAVVKAGVTGATVGLIVTSDNKVALQATGGTASLVLGGGFASATATSVGVSYNNTGANVNTTITSASAGISAPINVLNGVTSVTVTGLSATVSEFVTISGDFGFRKNANGDLEVAGDSVTARLEVGSVIRVGVTGAKLGIMIKADQTLALQTTNGSASINLGNGFATATATTLAVRYNNTGAAVSTTLDISVGGVAVSAPINVADGTISVVATGLNAQVGGFVTISGDMGFKKDATGRLIAAGNNVSASLDLGAVLKAGVTGATFGLIVKPDETVAFQTTGGAASIVLGGGFASVTATSVNVAYNNTGADVATTIIGTAAGISAPINVTSGTTAVTAIGLSAVVSEFVTISGDFGFRKTASRIEVVSSSASAQLEVGSLVRVGVTGAKLALIVNNDATNTFAFQTSNGSAVINLGSGFATATATAILVRYNNTTATVNETITVTVGASSVSSAINVAAGVISVVVNGLDAQVGGFVTLTGDFGFKRTSTGRLQGSADNASATLKLGSVLQAGVTGAKLGFIVTTDNKVALQTTGGSVNLNLGAGFATATATSVNVAFNNTGADVNVTLTGTGISTPINVVDGVSSVTVFGLSVAISDFVTLSGDFGFKQTASRIEVVANSASALLEIGSLVKVGVTGAKLAVIVNNDAGNTFALQSTGGSASISLGSGFATATATSIAVRYNNTAALVNETLTVSVGSTSISAGINVGAGITSVVVTGLSAQVGGFVTLSGDMGFKLDSTNGRLIAAGNNVSATLDVGSVIKAGVSGATVGLIVKGDNTLALQATGGTASIVLGSGFASVTATAVGVAYNNTGANVNTTITSASAGISAPINVNDGVTAVVATGLVATVSDFVTISGDFGLRKTVGGDLEAAGSGVSAALEVGSVVKVGISNGVVGLIVKPDQKLALQASGGSALLTLGSGFASATATSVAVAYNNTAANVNTTVAIQVGAVAVSAPINVTAGVTAVVVNGLSAQVLNFVTVSGNFGLRKTAGGELEVAATNASATLDVSGAIQVGVTAATLGLIVKPDQTLALQATGAASLNLGNGFATATATNVAVAYNNTGANVSRTISLSVSGVAVSAPVTVTDGVTAVVVTGLSAQVADFVTITGTFGFRQDSGW